MVCSGKGDTVLTIEGVHRLLEKRVLFLENQGDGFSNRLDILVSRWAIPFPMNAASLPLTRNPNFNIHVIKNFIQSVDLQAIGDPVVKLDKGLLYGASIQEFTSLAQQFFAVF